MIKLPLRNQNTNLTVIVSIMLLVIVNNSAVTAPANDIANKTSAVLTNMKELDKELKHIDLLLKAVNKFVISVNSYINAFNNILK